MPNSLAGKVALVTGGSRGLGAAIAKRLARDGASAALTYTSSPQEADEVVRAIESAGGRAVAMRAAHRSGPAVPFVATIVEREKEITELHDGL